MISSWCKPRVNGMNPDYSSQFGGINVYERLLKLFFCLKKENCSQFFTCTMKNPVSEMKSDEFQPCPREFMQSCARVFTEM